MVPLSVLHHVAESFSPSKLHSPDKPVTLIFLSFSLRTCYMSIFLTVYYSYSALVKLWLMNNLVQESHIRFEGIISIRESTVFCFFYGLVWVFLINMHLVKMSLLSKHKSKTHYSFDSYIKTILEQKLCRLIILIFLFFALASLTL